ncbi:hypothetical protein MOC16_gp368 [Klebsiella phage vB_KpM_FBKp24]|uniref:Uncharacterized protein n=1 Tax=Klebsiella phage vB_KpM_FBKp24 TaxID=2801834 RepID=A0A7U0J6H4_9CAUD|nr:hypothetical protein MOC16_gp368 [Klebsiella phage vB_KpM_FBKp24]QQV92350.1 hypothetical protein vBKpMFBKp24_045 [Klebsiella phage vB_KpM_FBKp24]
MAVEMQCVNCLTPATKKQLERWKIKEEPLVCNECQGTEFQKVPLPLWLKFTQSSEL